MEKTNLISHFRMLFLCFYFLKKKISNTVTETTAGKPSAIQNCSPNLIYFTLLSLFLHSFLASCLLIAIGRRFWIVYFDLTVKFGSSCPTDSPTKRRCVTWAIIGIWVWCWNQEVTPTIKELRRTNGRRSIFISLIALCRVSHLIQSVSVLGKSSAFLI